MHFYILNNCQKTMYHIGIMLSLMLKAIIVKNRLLPILNINILKTIACDEY